MYSMRGGGYQYPQGTTTFTIQPVHYDNNRTTQNYSSQQSQYVDRRSTNPVTFSQNNPSQYTGSKTTNIYYNKVPGPPSRNVNSALTINPYQPSRSQYTSYGKQTYYSKKGNRGEIDDSPIIDPSAFQYLNLNDRKPKKKTAFGEIESGIDSRPIINLDAVAQLERRRQQQLEKNNRLRGDDGSKAGIDDRSIVDVNAFRYIEARVNKNKENTKQGQGMGSGIDDRPITNPDAFKYLEVRRQQKSSNQSFEPSIDNRSIINPDAFKYIEKRDLSFRRNVESGIDTEPIVNPNAFRYLENNGPPSSRRDVDSGVDTTSIINPIAFQYIEKRTPSKPAKGESSVDYRPIVNPQAFKWIETKESKRRVDDGPDIDERSYVNPDAFRYIDRRVEKRRDISVPEIDTRSLILDRNPHALAHLERKNTSRRNDIESGIDERPYVNPDAFKFIEGIGNNSQNKNIHSSIGPSIDGRSYVDTESFRHLEGTQRRTQYDDYDERDGIDERSFIPSHAFRHLEFTVQDTQPYHIEYATYGQSDV